MGAPPLHHLHVRLAPMQRGRARLRVYDAPCAAHTAPRLQLAGDLTAAEAAWWAGALRELAERRGLTFTREGRARVVDD